MKYTYEILKIFFSKGLNFSKKSCKKTYFSLYLIEDLLVST